MPQDTLSNGLPLDSSRADTNGLSADEPMMHPIGTAAAATDASIETRLRRGSSKDFAFDSLLDGVSTLNTASTDRHHRPAETVQLPGMAAAAAADDSLLSAPEFRKSAHSLPPPQPSQQGPQQDKKSIIVLVVGIGVFLALVAIGALVGILQQNRQPGTSAASGNSTRTSAAVAVTTTADTAAEKRTPGHPDPALTPGERIGVVGRADSAPKPIPSEVRSAVFAAYGVDASDKRQVLCRLIPTSLGGTDSPKNLFPTTPWFSDLKTRLDRRLTQLVAEGKMTVEEAEKELTTDWVASAHRHYVRNYGQNDAKAAHQAEDSNRW